MILVSAMMPTTVVGTPTCAYSLQPWPGTGALARWCNDEFERAVESKFELQGEGAAHQHSAIVQV
jgi:hypothetical protein